MKLINLIKKFFIYLTIYLHVFTIQFYSFANAQAIKPSALPTGNVVTSGQVKISQSSATMNVNQSSNNAVISWNTFNIGSQATVNFNQPSSSSNTLNRVRSNDPSRIYGNLNANGNLFFINPNGVLFGNGARVNVEGLVATTMNMANNDFNQQNYNFNSSSNSTSSIINYGTINSNYVALISTNVKNSGEINTKSDLALVSGSNAKLAISSNGKLSVNVSNSTLENLVENSGVLKSENGQILIKSSAAKSLVASTINSPSQKKKLISQNGVIKLVSNTGTLKAKNIKIDAGENGRVVSSGRIDVSSDNSKAGQIEITGKEIIVESGSKLVASGKTGGGNVLIGGDWKGSGKLLQATYATVEKNTLIDASSTSSGDGGKIVIWSDIKNSKSKTSANGTLLAYAVDGDGGKIETSGSAVDTTGIKVNAGSKKGKGGLWLVDPYDYIIGASQASSISTVLNNGTNVTILTSGNNTSYGSQGDANGNGDITVNSSIATSGTATLTLTAARDLTISSGANITDTGTMSLALNSGRNMVINGGINIAGTVALTTTSSNSGSTSNTFSYTGSAQTWTAPSGVSSITFDVQGAQGGDADKSRYTGAQYGGFGGRVQGTLSVTAGNTYQIYVGGKGGLATSGGWNGGGNANSAVYAGSGGGASDIRTSSALSSRLVVAGGGGGAAGGSFVNYGGILGVGGAGGGLIGEKPANSSCCSFVSGSGGTQSAGGAKGTGYGSPSDGSLGQGGHGNSYHNPGGGGGYYGGGGGSVMGGGGGSSYTDASLASNVTHTQGYRGQSPYQSNTSVHGQIIITSSTTETGDLTIGSGGITAGGGLTISTDGDLDISSNVTASSLSVDGNIDLNSSTLNNSGSSNVTLAGVISGAGNLTHSGSGTLTLSGTNTYTGDTTITDGTLSVSGSLASGTDVVVGGNGTYNVAATDAVNSISGAGKIVLASSQTLTSGSTTDTIFSGVLSGSGGFTKTGTGKLTLTGANTFTGGLNVTAGTLTIGGTGSLGANNSNSYAGTIGISANSNLNYTSTTTPQKLTGFILLGMPLGAGSVGAVTGSDNHTITSAGGATTITYVAPASSGTNTNTKQKIQKQIPKFALKGNTFKPSAAPAKPGAFNTKTPPPGQPSRITPTPSSSANFTNANANINIATPGPKMIMPAMAKFSAIKFDPKGPGIKTNFKPMKGTSFANFKPVAFKVDPSISNFKIQPFKPIKFGSSGINYKIPEKNIEVPDNNVKMNFEIKMKGGAALPSWVKFDPDTLQISGKPPAGYQGTLELDLVATSEDGSQQSQEIEFTITE